MVLTTFGDLREEVAAQGLKWTVNPAFSDATPIARPSLGGLPEQMRKADGSRIDVAALVRAQPTTNSLLRAHLVQRGLLDAASADTPFASIGSTGLLAAVARTIAPEMVTAIARPLAGGGGPAARPAAVDWRNRFGWPWITEIRDQDPCEHCWVYAATALVEAMVRIEHCVWCMRSEGDYIEPNKVTCGQCGSPGPVLDWFAANGATDLDCVPWVDRDPGDRSGSYWNPAPTGCGGGSNQPPPAYHPAANRAGRTVKIPAYTSLSNVDDQKNWLDAIGPLVCGFDVYSDFSGWSGTSPYTVGKFATQEGGHIMLIVGYDDGLGCWIVKNSWGTGFGNGGWFAIAYGQCNIDTYAKLGLQHTNPDPWTKRGVHSGAMFESGDGALHRNFELLAPSSGQSFTHWWRDNSSANLPWAKAEVLGNDVAASPTFTGTTYNRNFETVYATTAGRLHHWWFDQASSTWNDGPIFGPTNAAGPVGFVESHFGPGNFEVVAGIATHQLQHWWRDGGGWHEGPTFGSNVASMGRSLIESSFGNLELVATLASGALQLWWRNGAVWVADATFGSGISSAPCMIQGQYGMNNEYSNGNFELCVALPDGTVQHWWRDNQASGLPWHMSATFGSGVAEVVAMVEGSFGFNLELVVCRTDGNLQHYWRDGSGWHAGAVIGPTH
jgi:hypothetical protein